MFQIKRYDINHIDDVLVFEKMLREQEDFWSWEIDEKYISAVKNSFIDERFKNSVSMLAYDDNKVVGRIDTSLIASHFNGSANAYLDWICVLKSYRHKGIAQLLMSAVRQELKRYGADSLIGIIAHNEEALSFYHAIQGAEIGDEGIRITIK